MLSDMIWELLLRWNFKNNFSNTDNMCTYNLEMQII